MRLKVSFQIITPNLYYTPLSLIPTEETEIEVESEPKNNYELSIALSKEFENLNINPDHIKIVEKYEMA